MGRATVALGSNLGDRLGQLRIGLAGIEALGTVVAVSSLYETEPVGGPVQGRYLNAVVVVETDLDPESLLAGLQRVEGDSDRRREVHWGPRTLDLDLITYDTVRVSFPHLEVPHLRAHERRFVLAPLYEVAPDVVLSDGSTPAEALATVRGQRIDRWDGAWPTEPPRLGGEAAWWVRGQFFLLTAWLVATVLTAHPGGAAWLALGALTASLGVGLGVAAVRSFGTQISPSPQPRQGSSLVDGGIYGLVRHPMYGAVILTTLGVAIAAQSPPGALMAVVTAVYLRAKSSREERILGVVFDEYSRYRNSVGRRFFPGIW